MEHKCSWSNRNCQQKYDEKLKERFFNAYKFSNLDNNKFIIKLWKGAYPYEYMDDWEKFNEKSLPEREDFEIKNLGYYHELYVQGDTLLLADVFDNFRNMCLKIYVTWSCKISFNSRMASNFKKNAWEAALKRTGIKLDLLTNIDMLLMVQKAIRGRKYYSIYWYAKDNKYMKHYDKSKELSYIQYSNVNNLYGWAMTQRLPVNNFEWIKDISLMEIS